MRYFNLHTHRYSADPEILELVNQYPLEFDENVPFYSVGIHPWHIAKDGVEAELQIIESRLPLKNCLALGECGLDKRIETPLDLQSEVFAKQLLLAEKFRKPVVLHCVAAYQEAIELKKKMNISVPLIIHGFSKSEQVAKQLLENGFYLSFGKYLLRNPGLETVFKSIPDDRFFLETDTIDESLRDVYALAAQYRKVTVERLQESIGANFKTVFKTEITNLKS